MNTTINHGMPKLPQAQASQAGGTSQGSAGTGSTGAAGAADSSDHVKLTDSARALQEAARTDDSAAIDSKQVEKIRQAIADGSYQVNPSRIVDRMLAMDAQIAATSVADKG
jgi:negative regulator of flagellin synthesis FlgM